MTTTPVRVARTCNNQCVFCNDRRELTGARVDQGGIQQAVTSAPGAVHITGGEPTMGAGLLTAIAWAHGLQKRVSLSTNGRRLTDPEVARRLRVAGLDEVAIGLHSVTPAIHRELVGGDPAAWRQSFQALQACTQVGLRTVLRTVLTRQNAAEIDDLIALAKELGVGFELRELTGPTRTDLAHPNPLVALWHARAAASQQGVPFRQRGFRRQLGGPDGTAPVLGQLAIQAILDGFPPPGARRGFSRRPQAQLGLDPAALSIALTNAQAPIHSARQAQQHAVDRVALVEVPTADPWLHRSVFPALGEQLARHGSVYNHRFDPDPHATFPRYGRFRRRGRPVWDRRLPLGARDDALGQQLASEIDLSGIERVILTHHTAVPALRANPTLSGDIVLLHLDGMGSLPYDLPEGVQLWTDQLGAAKTLALAGLDLSRVRWIPHPVEPRHHAAAGSGTADVRGFDPLDPPAFLNARTKAGRTAVIARALASGTLIRGPATYGLAERIVHGVNGFLGAAGEPTEAMRQAARASSYTVSDLARDVRAAQDGALRPTPRGPAWFDPLAPGGTSGAVSEA